MKRLNRLDFLGSSSTPVAGWSLAVVSAAMLVYVAAQMFSVEQDGAVLAQKLKLDNLAAATAAAAAAPRDALVRAQTPVKDRVNSLPWSEVLAVFNEHANARIGLMRFEPDSTQPGRFRVTAKARDAQTVMAFVRELEADQRLSGVTLSEQTLETTGAERAVAFTVLAAWRGDGATTQRIVSAR